MDFGFNYEKPAAITEFFTTNVILKKNRSLKLSNVCECLGL